MESKLNMGKKTAAKKPSPEKERATFDPCTKRITMPARPEGDGSALVPPMVLLDILATTGSAPTALTIDNPPTSQITMEILEKSVQRLRPDVNPSQTLASLATDLTSSQPTQTDAQPLPSQSISRPLQIVIPIVETKEREGGGDNVDVGVGAMIGEVEAEGAYSGATEVLSEGGTEVVNVGIEEPKAGELIREEEIEQTILLEEGDMYQRGGRENDVVVVTDDDEMDELEQPREVGLARNVIGTMVPTGRFTLRDEASEDEEEEEAFPPDQEAAEPEATSE